MIENHDNINNEDVNHAIQNLIFRTIGWCADNLSNSSYTNGNLSKKTINAYNKFSNKILKELNLDKKPRNVRLNYVARRILLQGLIAKYDYDTLLGLTLGKKSRTASGIVQVTVVTSPGDFSCAFDCYFCPKQEGMPRSYPKEGPSMRRAASWGFNTVRQIQGRISSYDLMGHPIFGCKSELIVLGGTWSSYSMEYRRKFITECYYAYNTYYDDKSQPSRQMLSLAEEKELNIKAPCRIIGLTIETRPDCITPEEIESFMEFGITRVQIGIQHTSNKILKKINRQCTIEQCMRGIKLLKDAGFKVLVHLMPNLPGSTPDIDRDMFDMMLTDPRLSFDEVKIYPTVVPTTSDKDINKVDTVLEKWYLDGKYVPYSNEELMEMLIDVLSRFPKDKRISRLFRDIPQPNMASGGEMPHMRDVIMKEMDSRGLYCNCIRSREIREHNYNIDDVKLEITNLLDELSNTRNNFRYQIKEIMEFLPTMTDKKSPVVEAFSNSIVKILNKKPTHVISPGTYDQKHIARIGDLHDCIAYGPGILDLAHQPDEYIVIDDMVSSAKVMAASTLKLLGVGS